MNLPYSDKPDVQRLSHLFEKMSECYKLFWFQAIVNQVSKEKQRITFDTLINDMVADAWYMVSEYRLNLGPADTLENLVHYAYRISGLKSNEKREKILDFLKSSSDRELLRMKRTLTYNVPYRLQVPFLSELKGKDWNVSQNVLAIRINQQKRLIYYFVHISGLQSVIEIQPDWGLYFDKLCKVEYQSYQLIWKYAAVHKEFEKCSQEHVNGVDVKQKLYRNGLSREEFSNNLEEIMSPVYQAAQNMGFANWHL